MRKLELGVSPRSRGIANIRKFRRKLRICCKYSRRAEERLKKMKCTLVQALRLCTGRTAHRGSRGIALLFHDYGTRRA